MEDEQKELLKAGANAAMQPFANLIDKLFGGAAEQIGGMWNDGLATRRQVRRISLYKKLQAAIEKAGFDPQQIPDNIWYPTLQEASLQDDETIQEQWANLLANAADPRAKIAIFPSFATILKDLTPREVCFLNSMYTDAPVVHGPHRGRLPELQFSRDALLNIYTKAGLSRRNRLSNLTMADYKDNRDEISADMIDFAAMMDLLIRNELMKALVKIEPIDMSKVTAQLDRNRLPRSVDVTVKTQYVVTELGNRFVQACRPPA